jgi:signal transduction histidine kinase
MVNVGGRIYEIHVTPLPVRDGSRSEGLYVSRDITERLAQAEGQAHQERMHVVGELAAVVAHELNNPLAAIVMFSQMLLDGLDGESPLREHADVILRNATTCKHTIRGLLDMAAFPKPEACEVDLADLLEDVTAVLRPLVGKTGHELRVESGADVSVLAVELQLRQVLVNLVLNAVQAGGERRVVVTIRTSACEDDDDVIIDVEDDGPGIPEDIAEHIFKPFFSTKPPGVGTGLGLPTSRRIVEAHGGTLDLLVSSEGRTVFRIVLPRKGSLRSMPPRGHFLGELLSHEGLAARGKVRDGKEV